MTQNYLFRRILQLIIDAILLLGLLFAVSKSSRAHSQAVESTNRVFLPMVASPITFTRSPYPLNLPVRLDTEHKTVGIISAQPGLSQSLLEMDYERAVRATLPTSGAAITATAADGALFT